MYARLAATIKANRLSTTQPLNKSKHKKRPLKGTLFYVLAGLKTIEKRTGTNVANRLSWYLLFLSGLRPANCGPSHYPFLLSFPAYGTFI